MHIETDRVDGPNYVVAPSVVDTEVLHLKHEAVIGAD